MENYSAIKDIPSSAGKPTELEMIVLREVAGTQRQMPCFLLCVESVHPSIYPSVYPYLICNDPYYMKGQGTFEIQDQ